MISTVSKRASRTFLLVGVFLCETTRFPTGRRGGVYAARGNGPAARNAPGHAKPHGGVKPRPTEKEKAAAIPTVCGKAKPHGRPAGRPYDRTGMDDV